MSEPNQPPAKMPYFRITVKMARRPISFVLLIRHVHPRLGRPKYYMHQHSLLLTLGCLVLACRAPSAHAQPQTPAPSPWSLHAQATYIDQFHDRFASAYEGANSLTHERDAERTFSLTLYLDRKLWPGGDLIFNPELFQGHGLSQTLGIAGFPNGEAVKSGFANLHYNTSRLFFRQSFGWGGEQESMDDDLNQLAGKVDVNRITFSMGKFAANDFFDGNSLSHDPRTQFMNWALWESAAWDYPADVVGFTAGVVAEWNTPRTTLRYGIFLEPYEANGARLDHHLRRAHGQIIQFDYRYELGGRHGTARPFVYLNQANMGSYRAAANQPYPEDVASTRAYRSKRGAGISWDQDWTENVGVFARLSWNDGRTESFSFTEIDRSAAAGVSINGSGWNRPKDLLGVAILVDGLSADHQHYLQQGGTGLILGDGRLSYSAEKALEVFYSFRPCKGLQISPDFQLIRNPGYNSARGPVLVGSVRAHLQY